MKLLDSFRTHNSSTDPVAERTRWALIVGGLLAGSAALVLGMVFYRLWLRDRTEQGILVQLNSLRSAGRYEECMASNVVISSNSRLYRDFQKVVNECQIAQAEKLFRAAQESAIKGDYVTSLREANRIPANSILAEDAQRLIARLAPQLLDQATSEFENGRKDSAIEMLQVIPKTLAAYGDATRLSQQWNQQWKNDASNLEAAKQALGSEQWALAAAKADQISDNPYWQKEKDLVFQMVRTAVAEIKRQQQTEPSPAPASLGTAAAISPELAGAVNRDPARSGPRTTTGSDINIRCYNSQGNLYYEGPAWGVTSRERISACR